VGLERGPLSFVSTTEELLGRKSSGSGLEIREYGRRDPSRSPSGTLQPQKLPITSPTCGGRSVDAVRSRTQSTEQEDVYIILPVAHGWFSVMICPISVATDKKKKEKCLHFREI
jgi:hypothetical protein